MPTLTTLTLTSSLLGPGAGINNINPHTHGSRETGITTLTLTPTGEGKPVCASYPPLHTRGEACMRLIPTITHTGRHTQGIYLSTHREAYPGIYLSLHTQGGIPRYILYYTHPGRYTRVYIHRYTHPGRHTRVIHTGIHTQRGIPGLSTP